MTTIRYFIPEDGDKEDHPNIFLMPKPTQSGFSPRLGDIKDSFPMPGKYHFRFKCPLIPGTDREKGAVAVWMDCVDNDAHVGVWRNTIFSKVTRINMEDDDDDDDFPTATTTRRSNGHAPPVPSANGHAQVQSNATQRRTQQQQQQRQPSGRVSAPPEPPRANVQEADMLGVFDTHTNTATSSSAEANLLGGLDSAHVAPPAPLREGSLLDMNGPTYNAAATTHDDFLGMTSTPVSSPPVSNGVPAAAPPSYGNPIHHASTGPRPPSSSNNQTYNAFSKGGDFGGLEWK